VVARDRHADDEYKAYTVLDEALAEADRRVAQLEENYKDHAERMDCSEAEPWVVYASIEDVGSVIVTRVRLDQV